MDLFSIVSGQILPWYLLSVNALAFILFGADKYRARHGAWRIPEKWLFMVSVLGGSVGAIVGMRVFHHKTLHWQFKYGIPAILVLQLAAAAFLWKA